uniref:Uncharacterized protein n=1 Tax=Anguilla anguilla TaxID=7936 RepID=A0A0E9R1A3_ANGAN
MEKEWEIMENRLRILFAYKENERTDKRVTKIPAFKLNPNNQCYITHGSINSSRLCSLPSNSTMAVIPP